MKTVSIRLRARRSLFSDPAFQKHRVSFRYPVVPSLLGAVEAIYWKPEALFTVESVGIIKPGSPVSYMFNHTAKVPVLSGKKTKVNTHDFQTDRRNTVYLEDVDYIVNVAVAARSGDPQETVKHAEMLARRVRKGQCHSSPFMGARELPVDFEPGDNYSGPFDKSLDTDFIVLPSGFEFDRDLHPFAPHAATGALFAPYQIRDGIMTQKAM